VAAEDAFHQEARGSFLAQAAGQNAHSSIDIQNAFVQIDKEAFSHLLARLSPQAAISAPEVKDLFEFIHNPEDVSSAIFRSEPGRGLAPYDIPHVEEREGGISVQEMMYTTLRRGGALLVQSRAGLGKTREAAQFAARLCAEGWTVCVAKAEGDSRMAAPAHFPDALRGRQLLFVLDDLHQRVDPGTSERKPYADRLNAFVEFFQQKLLPTEVCLLATFRTEPHHYDSLGFHPSHPLWGRFEVYDLPEFSVDRLQELLLWLAEREGVDLEKESVVQMIANSDRTPRTLEQNVRLARHRGQQLTADYWLRNQLSAWSQLFQGIRQRQPTVDAVYQSLHLLRIARLPTRFTYVMRLATKLAHEEATAATKELINLRLLGVRRGLLDAFGNEQLRDSLQSTGIPVPLLEDNWGRIIETMEGAVEQESESSQDLLILMHSLLSNGRAQDAEEISTKQIDRGQDNADLYYFRGVARDGQENFAGAEEDFTAAIGRGRDDAAVYYRRGFVRGRQENFAGAEEDLTAAIGRGQDEAEVYFLRGFVRGRQENSAGAEEDFTAAIGRGQDDAKVYFLRGLTRGRQEKENPAGVEEDFTAAIGRGQDDAKVYYVRGLARAMQKNPAGAEEDFTAAISRGRDDAEVYRRGLARAIQENFAGAEEDFTAAIGRGQDEAEVYFLRGFVRGRQENFAGAEEDFTAAISRGQDEAEVYYQRGLARDRQKNFAGAEEDFTAAISRGQDDAKVYFLRGLTRAIQENPAGAEEDFTAAISRGQDDAEVYYYYQRGLARAMQKNFAGAEEDFTAAIGRGQDDAKVYYVRGLARAMQKNPAGAEEDFTAAIGRGQDDASLYFGRELARAMQENPAGAEED
jgi:Tfp pilus assembly protein PilF